MNKKTYEKLALEFEKLFDTIRGCLETYPEKVETLCGTTTKLATPLRDRLIKETKTKHEDDSRLKSIISELTEKHKTLLKHEDIEAFLTLKKELIRDWQSIMTKKQQCDTLITKSKLTTSPQSKKDNWDPTPLQEQSKALKKQLNELKELYTKVQSVFDQFIGSCANHLLVLKQAYKKEQQNGSIKKNAVSLTQRLMALQDDFNSEEIQDLYLPLQNLHLASMKIMKTLKPVEQAAANESDYSGSQKSYSP